MIDHGLQTSIVKALDSYDKVSVCFFAELGAGKTTQIKELVKHLGYQGKVTSPTFIGEHQYQTNTLEILHFDIYQVAINELELQEKLNSDNKILVLVEWSEKLPKTIIKMLKAKTKVYKVEIKVLEDEQRKLKILVC